MNLNESIQSLLESKKYPALNESDRMLMGGLLEQTAMAMNENTMTQDVAQFTPIIMPLVRRVYPALVANELLGIQPLKTPTGFIYALSNSYTGDKINSIAPHKQGQIIVLAEKNAKAKPGKKVAASGSGANGVIAHVENDGKTILVNVEGDKKFINESVTVDGDAAEIKAVYTNEALFTKILKDYTGAHTTHAGELLAADMKEVGIQILRKAVEAKTRKLRGSYTLEMYEDLKNQHGLLADEELISLMKAEIQTEIDREVIDFVNNNSTIVANANYAPKGADGRWEVEKYRVEAIKIANESRIVGSRTRRGAANRILCTPKVVTMLEQIGSFKQGNFGADVIGDEAFRGVCGTFDGKKVVVDNFADNDYVTVLYKGEDRRDAMGYMSIYVPLEMMSVTDPLSGQPSVLLRTRYALSTTPMNPEAYGRTFGVDFTNTALA